MGDAAGGHRDEETSGAPRGAERHAAVGAGRRIVWHGSDRSDGLSTLAQGRRVGVAQFGRPGGEPVIWCHGGLSSRFDAALAGAAAARNGLRLIALDRPGIGRSSLGRNDDLLRWPAIVADCADQLGLDGFGVAGSSAGGAYALACAYALPRRVRAVATIAGMTAAQRPHAAAGARALARSPPHRAQPRDAACRRDCPRGDPHGTPTASSGSACNASEVPPSGPPLSRNAPNRDPNAARGAVRRDRGRTSRTIARSDPIGGSRRRSSPRR